MRVLLDECARSLPAPFTRTDIYAWFRERYPQISQNTIQTHIYGLTDEDTPGRRTSQFARHRSVLRRVGHGLYERAADDGAGGTTPPPSATHRDGRVAARPPSVVSAPRADVVLVGCVKSKLDRPAPARDLYTGPLFTRRRRYAEAAGAPWLILSSRWGLVDPDEVIAPYDLYLGGLPAGYRRAWGAMVTAQLSLRGPVRGAVVEVHAGDHYVTALRPELEAAGAVVVKPVDAGSLGETLAWYDRVGDRRGAVEPADGGAADDEVVRLVRALADEGALRRPQELRADRSAELAQPGLYAWWVDEVGAADLSAGLGYPIAPGLVYAGQAGATRWPSGTQSANTLRDRLVGMHLGGRAAMSTFRRSLAAVLVPLWGAAGVDEARLTAWMEEHLRVIAVPVLDADRLKEVETAALARLDPPLNLMGMTRTPLRRRLSSLRSGVRGES